jgi:membrane-bound metal-dependent hydrolase YbcI (DUF457 family)
MPTPVGHALGGLAAAFLAGSAGRHVRMSPPVLWASAAMAVAPDIDIVFGGHRSYTHSIGAVALVAAITWLFVRRSANALSTTVIITAAFSSHLLLDWLGKDTSPPGGLMLLWPLTSTYFVSGLDLFGEVSRRYWLPREFIAGNFGAVGWEVITLMPLVLIGWVWWSGRTLKGISKKEKRKRNKVG